MALHVEDQPLALEARRGKLRLERRFGLEVEPAAAFAAAALAALNARSVLAAPHAETRKSAARQAEPLRVPRRRLVREAVGGDVGGRERHGLELAVGGRVELDRQPPAVGIDGVSGGIS